VSMGLYGIALAFTLRASLDCVVLVIKAGLFDLVLLSRLLGPALILIGGLVASQWLGQWSWAIGAAAILSLALAFVCWLQMPEAVRSRLAVRFGI